MSDEVAEDLNNKHNENLDKIERVTAATFEWKEFFSTPIGKAFGTMAVTLLMLLSAWVTDKMNQKPIVPIPVAPPVVVVTDKPVPVPAPVSPIISPKGKQQLKLFVLAPMELMNEPDLRGIPITIDPKTYAKGSHYPFNGKAVGLPCMEYTDPEGKITDVVTFVTPSDIAAYWKSKQ